MRTFVSPLIALTLLLGGCVMSHRFPTGSVTPVPALRNVRMSVPQTLDARDNGRPSVEPSMDGKPRRDEITEMREAVADHVSRAGVRQVLTPGAPTNPDEMRAIMTQASQAGVEEVMFLRYHGAVAARRCLSFPYLALVGVLPWVIMKSIPLSNHGANAGFEAFVVSARTGELLASSSRLAAFSERINQWTCGPEGVMHEMMRESLHAVLEDVAGERRDGYVHRLAVPDIAELVVSAPRVRRQGSFLRGLGWSVPLMSGWRFDPDVGAEGGAVSPAGTTIVAETDWCIGSAKGCGQAAVEQLEEEDATIVSETWVKDRGATDILARTHDGGRLYRRVLGIPGLAFSMSCELPDDAPNSDYAACRRAFGAAQLSVVTREEG
jgi:hypothetical protein